MYATLTLVIYLLFVLFLIVIPQWWLTIIFFFNCSNFSIWKQIQDINSCIILELILNKCYVNIITALFVNLEHIDRITSEMFSEF